VTVGISSVVVRVFAALLAAATLLPISAAAQDWTYRVRPGDTLWDLGGVGVSPKSFYIAVICVVVLVLVSLAVTRTRLGKAMRAVSDNPALSASSGMAEDPVSGIGLSGGKTTSPASPQACRMNSSILMGCA